MSLLQKIGWIALAILSGIGIITISFLLPFFVKNYIEIAFKSFAYIIILLFLFTLSISNLALETGRQQGREEIYKKQWKKLHKDDD